MEALDKAGASCNIGHIGFDAEETDPMPYAIAYVDRLGEERPVPNTETTSQKKADAVAKKLNAAMKIKGNGRYVVIEL